MPEEFSIQGYTTERFKSVRTVFEENFKSRGEVGAACCIYHNGECVVDLWGGRLNTSGGVWERDTKVIVFSTIKGMASLTLAHLHSQGYFCYDDPVSQYWPEFSANGKHLVTIRSLLAHEVGLCAVDFKITPALIRDFAALDHKLAAQKPRWPVGTVKAYHAWTIGLYMDALCRRIDPSGRNLAQVFQDEIAGKLDVDCFIGRPAHIQEEEVAQLIPISLKKMVFKLKRDKYMTKYRTMLNVLNPFSLPHKVLLNPRFSINLRNFNKQEIQALPIASAMGLSSARGIAKIYNEFANQTPVLNFNSATLSELEAAPSSKLAYSKDPIVGLSIPISIGMAKSCDDVQYGNSSRSYGNSGTGGSCGFADPEKRIAYSYVMNKMGAHIVNDPREFALRSKVYEIIGEPISS